MWLVAGVLVLAAACDDGDDEDVDARSAGAATSSTGTSVATGSTGTSSADEGATTTADGDDSNSGGEGGGDDPGASEDEASAGEGGAGADVVSEPPQALPFSEVHARQAELVGSAVQVRAKSFFVARCPPPAPGAQAAECTLVGFLADPERTSLDSNEVDQAIVLAEGHRQVSCLQSAAAGGACPGWEQGRSYEISGVVEHQVLGGVETEYVQLDVTGKSPE